MDERSRGALEGRALGGSGRREAVDGSGPEPSRHEGSGRKREEAEPEGRRECVWSEVSE